MRIQVVLEAFLRFVTPTRLRLYPAVSLAVTLIAVVIYSFWDRTFFGADFRAFYTAGTFLRGGRSDLLYEVDAMAQYQSEVLGTRGVSAWLSPPYWAWPFAALSGLPFWTALLVHLALSLLAAALALTWLARELGLPRLRMAWIAAVYYPTLQWFTSGQMSAFWTLIVVAVFVLLRRGHDGWAGLVLGCLAVKPQLGVGLVFALLGARRIRTLVGAALTGGAWISVGYLTLPSAMREYWAKMDEIDAFLRADEYPIAGLHSLFQAGHLALGAFSSQAATTLGALLTALALVAVVRVWAKARWVPGDALWDRRMAATLALSTLTSPHLFGYDLVLLLVPFFVVMRQFPDGTAGRPLDGGPLLAVTTLMWALALVGPALTLGQQWLTRSVLQKSIAVQIEIPVMLAWIWLVVRPALQARSRLGLCNRRVANGS